MTEIASCAPRHRLWGCVVGHIRIYGVPEQYVAPDGHTWWGTYLYANDWKYWTMGTPVEQTILINRTNQEIDGGPLRRPDRWTLETLGATEMLAHLERQGLLASAPSNSRKPSPRTTKSLVSGPTAGAVRARRGSTAKPLA